MSRFDDPNFVREQYRTASNLDARKQLHIRFSTSQSGWFEWVYDHFDLAPDKRLLELGCGPGDLWLENLQRIPRGSEIILSDFTPGMVAQARQKLAGETRFFYANIDAHSIPFPDQTFHVVAANHMLYHVRDQDKALGEIRRVLKPQGALYTTTVGENHMKELAELVGRFNPELASEYQQDTPSFTLQNGAGLLTRYFANVEQHQIEDSLVVTEAAPLVDYIQSTLRLAVPDMNEAELTHFIENEMKAGEGQITITKESGLFIAR